MNYFGEITKRYGDLEFDCAVCGHEFKVNEIYVSSANLDPLCLPCAEKQTLELLKDIRNGGK